jgi:protein-L-isoaspartate(D-aspartate) O-methyltransferase
MIEDLKRRGISSSSVLDSMVRVPRHLFVSEALRYRAYDDISLPIGYGQTISKPSVIARMVEALRLTGEERVLEIGTGSGYQSAVIASLAGELVTMEIIEELFLKARSLLVTLGFSNVNIFHSGDFRTTQGLFDAVVVAAGADILPVELFEKVKDGGRLVIPLRHGRKHRIKRFIKKAADSIIEEEIGSATFVPYIHNESA